MIKVDNFKLIEDLLCKNLDNTNITTNSDKVLLGRIIRRKKENPEDPRQEYIVKRYTFANVERFKEVQDEIKQLCHMFNARFYVSTNIKSMKDIAFDVSERVPTLIRNEQYYFFRRIFDDVADANHGIKGHRLWIFDIDDKSHVNIVLDYLIQNGMLAQHFAGMIPTINGAHILMRPHDIRYIDNKSTVEFNGEVLKIKDIIDIKKNALTVAYYSDEKI